MKFDNKGNTVPIPEKIKITNDPFDDIDHTKDEKINSLIDVLTEQQKEIDDLQLRVLSLEEGQEAHGEWHENNRVEDLIPIINEMQGMKPYTAMRSTGESHTAGSLPHEPVITTEYCECKNPDWYSGSCKRCTKPIKSKEDIDKFVDYSINKYGKTYKALGKSQEDVREKIEFILSAWVGGGYSRQMTISEITNKILAIVKGE